MNAGYKQRIRGIVFSALIGALYVALTVAFAPISYAIVQFRLAEALCLLPFYAPETAFGLFVGCLLANILSPIGGPMYIPDIILGSLATLISAVVVSRMKTRWMTPLPVILANALIVGAELSYFSDYLYGKHIPFFVTALSVGLGELAVCALLGLPMLYALSRIPYFRRLFPRRFDEIIMRGATEQCR